MTNDQANYIAAALAVDQIAYRTLAAVLINREIGRNGQDAERELYAEVHRATDHYITTGVTPEHLMELDRQKARDLLDAIFGVARHLRDQT